MSLNSRQKQMLIDELKQQEAIEELRKQQKKYNITPSSVLKQANNVSNGINNLGQGTKGLGQMLSNSSNNTLSNLGSRLTTAGDKISDLSGQNLKSSLLNSVKGLMGNTSTPSTSAITNAIGSSGTSALPSTIGAAGSELGTSALGTGALGAETAGLGAGTAGLGAAAAGETAGLGSTVLGSSLLGATGAGTAGMGAAGATGALSGALGAETAGAGLGALGAGTAAGTGAGLGALGAAAGTAVPVLGAAIAIGSMVNNAVQKKKQENMQKSIEAAAQGQQVSDEFMQKKKQDLAQNAAESKEQLTQSLLNQYNSGNVPDYINQLADINQNNSFDGYDRSLNASLNNLNALNANSQAQQSNTADDILGTAGDILSAVSDYGSAAGYAAPLSNTVTDYQDILRNQGYSDDVVNGVAQGLNSGIPEIDNFITDYNNGAEGQANPINIPVTPEEIAAAREGTFNTYDNPQEQTQEQTKNSIKQNLMSMIKDKISGAKMPSVGRGINDLRQGYNENLNNAYGQGSFLYPYETPENVQTQEGAITGGVADGMKKGAAYRLGEALGSTRRIGSALMSNPWVQAGIAGIATKATGGDGADVLNNMYKYGIAKATSNYYNKALNGENARPDALQNFTADDYKARTFGDYRNTIAQVNADKLDANTYTKLLDYGNEMHNKGAWDDYTYMKYTTDLTKAFNDKVYAIMPAGVQPSNDTRKTDSDINYKTGRLEVDKEKNSISRQNANTNAARAQTYDNYTRGQLQNTANRNAAYTESVKNSAKKIDAQLNKDYEKQRNKSYVRMQAPDGTVGDIKLTGDAAKDREIIEKYIEKGATLLK